MENPETRIVKLGPFFFAASGGEVGGCEVASRRRGTGLNTLAFVLELKQQTLPMQTLKKCIKRCNKTEPKGGGFCGAKAVAGARELSKCRRWELRDAAAATLI